jgi:hypothetical protein
MPGTSTRSGGANPPLVSVLIDKAQKLSLDSQSRTTEFLPPAGRKKPITKGVSR